MSRKDYETIAALIRDAIQQRDSVPVLARRLAGALAYDNPRFNTERFLKACGLEEGTR